jgi:hypothetical protein
MIRVLLSPEEEYQAHDIGFRRAIALNARPDHASRRDKAINYHEFIGQLSEAVGAEMAVARYFKITAFKPTLNTFKNEADIGRSIEVKWTKWVDGHMVIHHSDRMNDVAVLVTGKSPTYQLAGWLPVSMAKSKRNWRIQEKNWWIGQKDLLPIEDFLKSDFADAIH